MAALLLLPGILLLLLLPTVSPAYCYTAKKPECKKYPQFIPGAWLAGEGVDIITLQRSGSFPVDTQRFQRQDGSCTLCANTLQSGALQRLPLALTNWRAHGTGCQHKTISAKVNSKDGVSQDSANNIRNDWRLGLNLGKSLSSAAKGKIKMNMAGSDSNLAKFASEKSRQDQYVFTSDKIECRFYSAHLVHSPPLHPDFRRAISDLPTTYDSRSEGDYERFITSYGTHIIRSMQLGGRITTLTALRTCELTLNGLNAKEVAKCLSMEAELSMSGGLSNASLEISAAYKTCEELKKQHKMGSSFHQDYQERYTEVVGGNHTFMHNLLFEKQYEVNQFKIWADSLTMSPGLVEYTLEPLHVLLKKGDTRRDSLREAVSKYILNRVHWQDCNQPCPGGQYKSPNNPCECVCHSTLVNTHDCCPRERGMASLDVMNFVAKDLWGDPTTATDAYLIIKFGNQEMRVSTIWNDDNPSWIVKMNFGYVSLTSGDTLTVQVWDADDGWNDDLLGTCERVPLQGTHEVRCFLDYGELRFFYHVQCLPYLGGPNCMDYNPTERHSGFPVNESVIYKL